MSRISILLVAVTSAFCANDNLLSNPDVELGNRKPHAWHAAAQGAIWARYARFGQRCLQIQQNNNTMVMSRWESDPVPVTPGVRYIFSAWFKTRSVLEKRAWIWITTYDVNNKYCKDYFLCKTEGTLDWTENSRCFTPRDKEVFARANMGLFGNGTFWADNFALRKANMWIDDNASLQINNKGFFPIGLYTTPTNTDFFDEITQAGFNTVLAYSICYSSVEEAKKYLDIALNKNIYIVFSLKDYLTPYRSFDTGVWLSRKKLINFVTSLRNHPALLTWYIGDEPECQGVRLGDIISTQGLVKSMDAEHPTLMAFCKPDKFEYYFRYVDIPIPDVYPVPYTPVSDVGKVAAKAKTVAGSCQPVWYALQAFDPTAYDNETRRLRAPTYAEMRCMTFLAIANGAKGILYYVYDSKYKIYKDPAHWADLKKIAGELKSLSQILLAPEATFKITVQPTEKLIIYYTRV